MGVGPLSGASVLARETWIVRKRPQSTKTHAAGTQLGPYRLGRRLGAGASGLVYEATHDKLGRRVALKILREELSSSPTAVSRFFSEAQMINAIAHENIVEITDLVDRDKATGTPAYYVMELLLGETLHDLISRGPLESQQALQIASEIASGLAAAHAAGIVHRDIKPANVFVKEDGHVKLLDFGVAKLSTDAGLSAVETAAGMLVGTPGYMAPEQALSSNVDPRADVYAFGVVLFEMVTGQAPFADEDARALILKHREEAVPDPAAVGDGKISATLSRIIVSCLAKDPDQRPQNGNDLQYLMTEVSRRRSPWWIPAALLLVAGLGALLWLIQPSPDPVVIKSVPAVPTAPPALTPAPIELPVVPIETSVNLDLESEPAGAQVIVDGKELGLTPMSVSWPRSKDMRLIEFKLVGHHPVSKQTDAESNQTITVVLAPKTKRPSKRRNKIRRKSAPSNAPDKSVSPTRILNPFEDAK